jgi:hypothetical protein
VRAGPAGSRPCRPAGAGSSGGPSGCARGRGEAGSVRAARRLVAAAGLGLVLALGEPGEAQRPATGPGGTKAYDAAQAAASAAGAAQEEGARLLVFLRRELGAGAPGESRTALEQEAAEAERALAACRGLAQASADEAMRLLVEAPRGGESQDRARRQVAEDRALLAGREAEVMAARARTEAERIRALLAEARLLAATGSAGRAGAAPAVPRVPTAAPARSAPDSGADAGIVPNLVGARLEAAGRDLEDAGLRLGAVTGPREGFVVRQSPEAGARLARGAAVGVTLSGTAATATDASP